MKVALVLIVAIISISTLALVAVADHGYPQGEVIGAGTPDWYQLPSPETNPNWVRFYQNNDTLLIYGSIAVIIAGVGFYTWLDKKLKKTANLGKQRRLL